MPSRGAPLPDAYCSQRKVQLVVNHQQVLLRINFVFLHQLQYGQASEVHICLRLGQQHFFLADPGPRRERLTVPVINHHSALIGNAIDGEKTYIVRRELVFDSRIAKTNEQFHVAYFLPSMIAQTNHQFHPLYFLPSGAFLPSLPSLPSAAGISSSVSCLPFLMTSGSAGAAAASAATASGVGATSSFTEVMWATV